MAKQIVFNQDCMIGMKEYPDKYFDLAIVDPPYGIGYDTMAGKAGGTKSKNSATKKKVYHATGWDVRPSKEYFVFYSRQTMVCMARGIGRVGEFKKNTRQEFCPLRIVQGNLVKNDKQNADIV